MFFEGTHKVFESLFEKKRLLEAGDSAHTNIRPLLLILHGTMRGVYGGGQVTALQDFGLTQVFDTVVGVSTGAPTGAYFCAGQARTGTSIYHEECASQRFIVRDRLMIKIDLEYIAEIFRKEGPKQLDEYAVRKSRTELYVGVTCARTGKPVLLNAKKDTANIVQAIRASIAIPGISGGAITINGQPYLDGIGACPLPIQLLIEKFDPTDILVCANCPENGRSNNGWEILWGLLTYRSPPAVRSAFVNHGRQFDEELEIARHMKYPRIGILWSDKEVTSLERHPGKLLGATNRAYHHLADLLQSAQGST